MNAPYIAERSSESMTILSAIPRRLALLNSAQPNDGRGGAILNLLIFVLKSRHNVGQQRCVTALRNCFDRSRSHDPILIVRRLDQSNRTGWIRIMCKQAGCYRHYRIWIPLKPG